MTAAQKRAQSNGAAQFARLRTAVQKAVKLMAEPPRGEDEASIAKALRAELDPIVGGPKRRAFSPIDIIAQARAEGPVVHEPTGFPSLDASTMGGPVFGSRWYVLGEPDASKTALLTHLTHTFTARGLAVGMLAIDEDPIDVLGRLGQRVGLPRIATERRAESDLETMTRQLGALPLRIYDDAWTIESAARDVAQLAAEQRTRGVLIVDSLQSVRCDAETLSERELSETQAIGLRVRALRTVATEHRLIMICTSEMSRGAYRAIKKSDRINPMAAGKWSGAIEYSARVMLALACAHTDDHTDIVQIEIIKNKHGRRRYADQGDAIYLRLTKASQTLEECDAPAEANEAPSDEDRAAERDAKAEELWPKIASALVRANAKGLRLTNREEVEALVRGDTGVKKRAVTWARATGRLIGGRGKPFAVGYPGDESEAEDATGLPVSDRSEQTGAPTGGQDRSASHRGADQSGPIGAETEDHSRSVCREAARQRAREDFADD